ncbi:MAG: redox-sensing transcriptional repressor Rex [Candidatus Rokubacteria bacterium RIFCSPLOWO2_02_FULL_73_56]|nr:MAG: redox-sensing transcriptional repressor Rex [Candidatus Rokubacteria bacterium RIFCSPHIGHO2_02_FULL_73_26]OGL11143.1 MAG: redox-sensing transcriptional repressor Rex [Candidatus Rokubacteria bacterium RIFCSPLOWO2_02_FULL_73_56]OGL29732.1 MAG: redox-sensing transcriptional repressor Rex [Candidatus Rokubacteria bacterium RIFCSPLOWO2_12_FULL_73_47]
MPRRPSYRLPKIPEMTIRRLSVYTRCLLQLEEDGVKTVSSQELADRFTLNSAQVRKDLAYFGEFGVRGIGYYVSGLKAELQRILGLDREWAVALVGFGNLGSALFHYRGFGRQGFRIAAIFDDDPAKVGREVDSTPVFPSRDLGREVKARGIQIAIVAVPAEAAQAVTDQLVAAGIRAVLNFAPARLKTPKDVRLKNVDLSIELETLSFYLAKGAR